MYLLASDIGALKQNDSPEMVTLKVFVTQKTIVRIGENTPRWKVHSSEVKGANLEILIRPLYCRPSSKKFKLELFVMPCNGFKIINDRQLTIDYQDKENKTRTLILTAVKNFKSSRPASIKEVLLVDD